MFDHLARGNLRTEEGSSQIDGDHTVEVRRSKLQKRTIAIDAGIVDQHVGATEFRGGLANPILDIALVRDIAAHEERGGAERLYFVACFAPALLIRVQNGDRIAALREAEPDAAADALTAAGDCQNFHCVPPCSRECVKLR